jgi:hypothetical protein
LKTFFFDNFKKKNKKVGRAAMIEAPRIPKCKIESTWLATRSFLNVHILPACQPVFSFFEVRFEDYSTMEPTTQPHHTSQPRKPTTAQPKKGLRAVRKIGKIAVVAPNDTAYGTHPFNKMPKPL